MASSTKPAEQLYVLLHPRLSADDLKKTWSAADGPQALTGLTEERIQRLIDRKRIRLATAKEIEAATGSKPA